MPMSLSRWQAVSQSQFAWEREALDWLRNHLPDREPWHAWTNFEFIDEEGKVNEVDALILTPAGLFLIEIKSRPGVVAGAVDSPHVVGGRPVDDVWIEPITEELDQADGVGLPPLVGVALPGTRIGLRGLLFAASGDEVAEPVASDVSGWR